MHRALELDPPNTAGRRAFKRKAAKVPGVTVVQAYETLVRAKIAASKLCPWPPSYPGAEVRSCDFVHIPGTRSLSVLAAVRDDVVLADQILGRALLSIGWTSEPAVIGALVFHHQTARETARVIWGPDPTGHLPTAFMISIDLAETALSELPQ